MTRSLAGRPAPRRLRRLARDPRRARRGAGGRRQDRCPAAGLPPSSRRAFSPRCARQPARTSAKPPAVFRHAKRVGSNPGAMLPKPCCHPASELTERPLAARGDPAELSGRRARHRTLENAALHRRTASGTPSTLPRPSRPASSSRRPCEAFEGGALQAGLQERHRREEPAPARAAVRRALPCAVQRRRDRRRPAGKPQRLRRSRSHRDQDKESKMKTIRLLCAAAVARRLDQCSGRPNPLPWLLAQGRSLAKCELDGRLVPSGRCCASEAVHGVQPERRLAEHR